MSAKNSLQENSLIPLVFNEMFGCAGGRHGCGWLHSARVKSDTSCRRESPGEGAWAPAVLISSLISSSSLCFALHIREVNGKLRGRETSNHFQEARANTGVGVCPTLSIIPHCHRLVDLGFSLLACPSMLIFPFLLAPTSLLY